MKYFQYTFKRQVDGSLKGDMMDNNNHTEFSKKGIPERIIEIVCDYFRTDIKSSSLKPTSNDFLVDASKSVWDRLVNANNNAQLNLDENRYVLKYNG